MNPLPVFPQRRRLFALALLATVMLLPACAKKSAAERSVDEAVKRYGSVATGMSKRDVVAKLGEPTTRTGDRYRWETVAGPENLVALEVRFDGSERVVSVATTRAKSD